MCSSIGPLVSVTQKVVKNDISFKDTLLFIEVVHNLRILKLKPEKSSGLNGIRTFDRCDTGAVLSSQLRAGHIVSS